MTTDEHGNDPGPPVDLSIGPDGQPPRFCWFDPRSDEQVYAATADDLLAEWMPGYLDRDEAGRLDARTRHALHVRRALVGKLAAEATDLTEEQRQVLLAEPDDMPDVERWDARVPLVLLDTRFRPHTDRPAPVADGDGDVREATVLWLRVSDAEAYLLSLAHAGVIRLDVHA
ncbi:hypothetical protein JL107_08800 [Nakamurella flavida]|uniref:Uncharacterized protein n=1 Tax=Nakamurella flavida TaxID=363630 RepID=A0A938YKU4_9ACTN|nr:hypothetical protein [Nakamurella flavida]MBM9476538.1 hypothetical protein [Nakamurella flavida]MDP9779024.1 hypothetical protein [Nakamurella flavida]